MTPFHAVAAPLLRDNVDTDAIIPSREMKAVSKDGLAEGLFAGWRYVAGPSRTPDPMFVLNDPRYEGAQILLAGSNFGCGSSREHAVWALKEYGFRVIVAPSFNPIFQSNCIANAVAPIELEADVISEIARFVDTDPQRCRLEVDVAAGHIEAGAVRAIFRLDQEARETLITGLDPIERTLRMRPLIDAVLRRDRLDRPWCYLADPIASTPEGDFNGS